MEREYIFAIKIYILALLLRYNDMAYIAPNSTIQLFKDIRLSHDSEDTFYFSNKSVQDTFFTQHIYATYNNNSYTRLKKNTIKIAGVMVNLYNCNYMRFINSSFENKWFYAFVTKVDYINNETVEIDYIIDEIQTWLFSPDVAFEQCFIERQHDRYDNLFGNLIPENIDVGELICADTETYALQSDVGLNVGILVSTLPDGTRIAGGMAYGIFTGLGMYGGSYTDILNIINRYTDPSNIVLVFMYPAVVGNVSISNGSIGPWLLQDTFDSNPDFTRLGNYTPKNNKLYTYPYYFVRVYSAGQERDYRWENWNTNATIGQFLIHLTYMPPVTSACVPYRYKGQPTPYDEMISISNFPQCAWNEDTYKAWYAQHKASYVAALGAGVLTSFAGGIDAVLSQGRAGVGEYVSGVNQITATVASGYDMKHAPPTIHGAGISDALFAGTMQYDFTAKKMCVKPEIAEKIDNFFNLYGYKQNKLAYPDLIARENWCYIKTIGCGIHGDLPSDSITAITNKFNSGIRFWKNPLRVGDYSMSNLPMGAQP